jgi:hypothetical protein
LRESLEVYIRVGDRDIIGRSFSELTDALIFAGRFREAIEVARRGLTYLEGDVSVSRVRLLDGKSQALASAEGYEPAHLKQAEIRRFHAMMLIDRAAPGDRERAQILPSEALETYKRIGTPGT